MPFKNVLFHYTYSDFPTENQILNPSRLADLTVFVTRAANHSIKPIHGHNFHSCVSIFFFNSAHTNKKKNIFGPLAIPFSFTLYDQ
jgi:hypothetical protein